MTTEDIMTVTGRKNLEFESNHKVVDIVFFASNHLTIYEELTVMSKRVMLICAMMG